MPLSKHGPDAVSNRRLVNRLKDIRSAKGLTQAELAEQVGVSRKTINTVENGVFVPSTQLAFTLAEVLKLRVDEIFSLE
jgi:putative transcriptional regulator